MSIFLKVFTLFCVSFLLMLYLSSKTNDITDEKVQIIYKEKYIQASKELFNYMSNGDEKSLLKRLKELNYEKKEIKILTQNKTNTIYENKLLFGNIKVLRVSDSYMLYMKYLDEERLFYDKTQKREHEQKELLNYLIIADISVLVIMFLIIVKILTPIKNLSKGMEKFGSGDYSWRLQEIKSKDEISKVINRFNTMAENLETLIVSRTQFLSDVSHELRTPISKAKISLEMMPESKYKDILKKSIQNMDELTNELLELERLNSNNLVLNFEKCSINTVLAEALSKMIVSNEEDISVEIINSFECNVDINYLSIAIKNLIDNALKYKAEGIVEIVVDNNYIEIKNFGDKLSKELEYYMQTFIQADKSRNAKGYGLGLNIVKRVLDYHSLSLKYSYFEGKNSFRIEF